MLNALTSPSGLAPPTKKMRLSWTLMSMTKTVLVTIARMVQTQRVGLKLTSTLRWPTLTRNPLKKHMRLPRPWAMLIARYLYILVILCPSK